MCNHTYVICTNIPEKEGSTMTNIDMENYIKDLSPELQTKAHACKSNSELLQFAADNDLEIPMDALEGVAGGCGGDSKKDTAVCNRCSTALEAVPQGIPKTSGDCKWCPKCKKVLISADWHIEKR